MADAGPKKKDVEEEEEDDEEEEEEEDGEEGDEDESGGDDGTASVSVTISLNTEEKAEAERVRKEQEALEVIRRAEEERNRPRFSEVDMERMQIIISDLSRRLKNAEHTIQAQRENMAKTIKTEETYRGRIGEISNMLRFETSKNSVQQRKALQVSEATRYENEKKRSTKLHEDLRMARIDHEMTGIRTESLKLKRMKAKMEEMDKQQDSQKLLLKQLSEFDKLIESLCDAAQHGRLEEVRMLLKRGTSVNESDTAGYLPLYYACANGHADIVHLLLEFGADASSYVSGHSSMEIAGRKGHTHIIKLLLKFGANIEDKGYAGSTALVSAVAAGNLETVHELLQLGANVQAYNFNEDTCLHVAAGVENPVYLIRLLLKYGADKKCVNRQGQTAARLAMAKSNSLAIEALGGRGAMVDLDQDLVGHLNTRLAQSHLPIATYDDDDDASDNSSGRRGSVASSVTFGP